MRKRRLLPTLMLALVLASCGGTSENSNSSTGSVLDSTAEIDEFSFNESSVGVDIEKFNNETLYPVDKSSFDYIFYAETFGVNGNDTKDDSNAFQSVIAAAKNKENNKTKLIMLPEGDILISEGLNDLSYEYGIILNDLENTTICGGKNTTIYFASTMSNYVGFSGERCKNVKFANFSIDWATLPFSMGVVESFDLENSKVVVKVNEDYPVDETTEVIEYLEFDKSSNLPRNKGNFAYIHNANKYIADVNYLGDQTLEITFQGMQLTKAPVGTKVVLAHTMTMGCTMNMHDCENLYFEHVNLYSSKGMAIRIQTSYNLYFNHFRAICKPGTDRLMTATADILHLKNNGGEIVVTNSQFENSHDDAINIASHFLRIKELYPDGSVRLISQLGMGETFAPRVGDVYEINNPETMALLSTRTVKSVQLSTDGYIVSFEEGGEGLEIDNAVANASRVPAFTFKNNIIRNKRNRGILVQTRNVTIENNLFSNIIDGPLMLMCEAVYFHEAISPRNVVIRNNKFLDNCARSEADIIAVCYGVNYSIGVAGVISDITIDNNFFGYSKNVAISLKGVSDSKVTRNAFYGCASAYTQGAFNCAISLTNVKNLDIEYNRIDAVKDSKFSSVYLNTGVNLDTVRFTQNQGFDLNEIMGEPDPITIFKTTKQINVEDNSLADWAEFGQSMQIIACTDMNINEIYQLSSESFSAQMKVVYDDYGLYYAFDVIDDELNFLEDDSYLGDCVEIYLTTNTTSYEETSSLRLENNSTIQLRGTPENYAGMEIIPERTSPAIMSNHEGVKLKVWVTETGYQGEGFIPFDVIEGLSDIANSNGKISFTMNFFDNDSYDVIKYYSTTRHPVPTCMRAPKYMSKIIFGGNQ